MRENKNKTSLFEKRGFFVSLVVIVSVMVIAVIMNMIVPDEIEENTFDAEVWDEAVKESAKQYDDGLNSVYNEPAKAVISTQKPRQNDAEKTEKPLEKTDESKNNQNNETGAVQNDAPEEELKPVDVLFERPVDGSVTKDYSGDELVYSDTMQDWRVHQGIDFAADEGADVKAVADGVIESVTDNGMLGVCVVVGHSDGVKSIYANLQKDSATMAGSQVKTGDVIAKAGKTAALEIDEPPHIHFEVIYLEKKVNPHDYFREPIMGVE